MEFYSKQKCFITTLHASKLVSFANSTFIPANICGKEGNLVRNQKNVIPNLYTKTCKSYNY